jgi:uncharacterized protein (TIGR03083 family)
MPRPTTKEGLLQEIDKERHALEEFLSTLTPDEMLRPNALGPWSVKDVLAHLLEWEQMFLRWYKAGSRGKIPEKPAPGFKWNQLPALNQQIYERYCDQSLPEVQKQFRASYRQLMKTLQGLPEEDIFMPNRFAWTEKHALLAFILPNTSSHYRWARTEMQKAMKKKHA